jgi:CRISPR/Cas system-associated exonuclease Cas4 (RecB family)
LFGGNKKFLVVDTGRIRYIRFMRELKNEFSWSKSRDGSFQICLRQYYFNYYGYWNGWLDNAPLRTRQIYILKNLKTRHMWAGEMVHQCIERTIKNLQRGIPILDSDQVISITLNRMRADFKSSRAQHYLRRPKSCALFEHEYDLAIPDELWKETADNVERCLKNFYNSEIFREMQEMPAERWLETEQFSHFMFEGVKIWVVMDCCFRSDSGITIIDWKTGTSTVEDNSIQLSCYTLYVLEKWGIEPGKIKIVEYNLSTDTPKDFSVTWRNIEDIKGYIGGSIADMRSLLIDVDHNTPKDEACFKPVDDRRICEGCNFRRICKGR